MVLDKSKEIERVLENKVELACSWLSSISVEEQAANFELALGTAKQKASYLRQHPRGFPAFFHRSNGEPACFMGLFMYPVREAVEYLPLTPRLALCRITGMSLRTVYMCEVLYSQYGTEFVEHWIETMDASYPMDASDHHRMVNTIFEVFIHHYSDNAKGSRSQMDAGYHAICLGEAITQEALNG